MTGATYTLCIVDDDPAVCAIFSDIFTHKGYNVITCLNAEDALEVLPSRHFDMLIADIQMPGMNGFNLLDRARKAFPAMKRVLMTGRNVDDYLSMIRKADLGNILVKNGLFNIEEIILYIDSLLTGNVFGLEQTFPHQLIKRVTIASSAEAQLVCSNIVTAYAGPDKTFIEMALNELITNAVFHAILGLSGVSRELWSDEYVLNSRQPILVSWARDAEKLGISVEDPVGELKKKEVLRWFDHQAEEDNDENQHGRGLLLIRRLIDRFIINIDPGRRTECIIIHFEDRSRAFKIKPITINEI